MYISLSILYVSVSVCTCACIILHGTGLYCSSPSGWDWRLRESWARYFWNYHHDGGRAQRSSELRGPSKHHVSSRSSLHCQGIFVGGWRHLSTGEFKLKPSRFSCCYKHVRTWEPEYSINSYASISFALSPCEIGAVCPTAWQVRLCPAAACFGAEVRMVAGWRTCSCFIPHV